MVLICTSSTFIDLYPDVIDSSTGLVAQNFVRVIREATPAPFVAQGIKAIQPFLTDPSILDDVERELAAGQTLPWRQNGVLQLARDATEAGRLAEIVALHDFPADWVRHVGAGEAADIALQVDPMVLPELVAQIGRQPPDPDESLVDEGEIADDDGFAASCRRRRGEPGLPPGRRVSRPARSFPRAARRPGTPSRAADGAPWRRPGA